MRNINLLIGGKPVKTTSGREGDVFNPNTGEVQARVGFSSTADVDLAVQAAAKALPGWASTNPQRRARVMFEFKRLVEANCPSSDNLRQRGRLPNGGFCSSGVGV